MEQPRSRKKLILTPLVAVISATIAAWPLFAQEFGGDSSQAFELVSVKPGDRRGID
jgi:hypothetical protein